MDEQDDEELSSLDSAEELDDDDEDDDDEEEDEEDEQSSDEDLSDAGEVEGAVTATELINGSSDQVPRKRKRKNQEEELEDAYMRKVAREEAKADAKREAERGTKRIKTANGNAAPKSSDDEASDAEDGSEDGMEDSGSDDELSDVPLHESLAPSGTDLEVEKSARTVFLGNVSTEAILSKSAKKTLLNHLASFLSDLPESKTPHKVESLRFRSTAFASAIPKKAAFAKKELLDATTKSTNAYAVYSTTLATREAAKRLNGTVVLDRHLRVDEVAHPAKTDHRRCVFVGNLGFVDDESAIQAADEAEGKKQKQKKKEPGDVEEGLWRQFGKCGTVESVRVVRDAKTRVGKGFAYVQFTVCQYLSFHCRLFRGGISNSH